MVIYFLCLFVFFFILVEVLLFRIHYDVPRQDINWTWSRLVLARPLFSWHVRDKFIKGF